MISMKQIKFRSRTERVLRTAYIVLYAFRSNTELVPVFQSTGTLVPFGILANPAGMHHLGKETNFKMMTYIFWLYYN